MDHTVQPVAAGEIDACAAAYAAAYREAPWNEEPDHEAVRRYIRAFTGRDGFCAWRLAVDGEIAGVALGVVVPCTDAPFLRVEDFCVAPKWQRQGLGGAFLSEIRRLAADMGCDSVLLATQPDVPARRFYLKQGFREIPAAYLYADCRPDPQ